MNKIYRTVYNETTGTWVAVAEIATAHGKSAQMQVVGCAASGGKFGNLLGVRWKHSLKLSVLAASLAMVPVSAFATMAADSNNGNYLYNGGTAQASGGGSQSLNYFNPVTGLMIIQPHLHQHTYTPQGVMRQQVLRLGGMPMPLMVVVRLPALHWVTIPEHQGG